MRLLDMFPSVAYVRWRYALRRLWLVLLIYPYRWLCWGLWNAGPYA